MRLPAPPVVRVVHDRWPAPPRPGALPKDVPAEAPAATAQGLGQLSLEDVMSATRHQAAGPTLTRPGQLHARVRRHAHGCQATADPPRGKKGLRDSATP